MFDFQNSVFDTEQKEQKPSIPQSTQVVFVSDMFVDDYCGGAELTTQALIDSSPFEIYKLHSKDVTMETLRQGNDKFWVFGNFANMNPQLIPSIVGNLKYSIVEYDFKFCSFRSPEKHLVQKGKPCDCDQQMNGKVISAFFYGSMGIWWMSEEQMKRTHSRFPFLSEKDNIVLSSIFPAETLGKFKALREAIKPEERKGWVVLDSPSWIKGASAARDWCNENKKDALPIWDRPYDEVLATLASAEGFVYLPVGGDTCPRMVIEAKLLGCELEINDNVLHKDEDWFATDDTTLTESYLLAAPGLFWNGIKKMMNYKPSISGYITTYNCVDQGYPFEQAIQSMLGFCDEVCIVDGGSSDQTLKRLAQLAISVADQDELTDELVHDVNVSDGTTFTALTFRRIKVKVVKRDWSHPRHAVFDGMQKAEARDMCTKEFCWQMDSDEVVHEDDTKKIHDIARNMSKSVPVIALPVIEYWGGSDKVRMDINPWKWRLSRNDRDITHGIPVDLRRLDDFGDSYAAVGTDGCDMISKKTGERVPFVNFYNQEVDNARRVGMMGNEQARGRYEQWFNHAVAGLPCVFHYSWFDLPRKIRLYRDFWQNHWNALYNKDTSDTAENNMMFDVPWLEVTDEMIVSRAAEMKEKLGGWIWHTKWDGKRTTPHIRCGKMQPKLML